MGAGLFVLGDILTIFVQRTYQLVFTFGVVRGTSFTTITYLFGLFRRGGHGGKWILLGIKVAHCIKCYIYLTIAI